MFTGIVQGTGIVTAREGNDHLLRLMIDCGALGDGVQTGASVSVAGVCLTATTVDNGLVAFDLMSETMQKTTLGSLHVGDRVNIERSAKVGDEIGGHRVSGHVTGMAEIVKVDTPPENRILTIRCVPAWMDYVFPKGFVALDGCSLTVVDVGPDFFTVHLIPETLRITTFGEKKIGDRVNLELDPETMTIVETVKKYLRKTVV